jgi:hypothetical protein
MRDLSIAQLEDRHKTTARRPFIAQNFADHFPSSLALPLLPVH